MNNDDELDPMLRKKVTSLRNVPDREPEKVSSGLAAFLSEAQELKANVTKQAKPRRNMWMYEFQSLFNGQRKEHSHMFGSLATLLVIVSLILGGSGVSVAAAQNSLPEQPLYGLKLLGEKVQLGLTSDPEKAVTLALKLTDRRALEISTMLQKGIVPSPVVQTRYQAQIENVIKFALRLTDQQAGKALSKIQTQLQTQEKILQQTQSHLSTNGAAALGQIEQMLQIRLRWIETGLDNPSRLREQLRDRDQLQEQFHQSRGSTESQESDSTPGTGSGNPWTAGTPTPGSGYGPGIGTGECGTCTPTTSNQGGNPWTTDTPTPGSGYGPGPGPDYTNTCTPESGSGTGPQPTQLRTSQPTQAGSTVTAGPNGPNGKP